MQTGVNLNVLGGFALQVDGQKGPDLPRKTRALLAVLAVDDAKPVSRETLAELLWPGRGPEQSKNSLKEAIYGLRKPLRAHDVVITRDGGLSLGAAITTDIATFRHLAGANELPTLRRAADAYAGSLMAGFRTPEDDFNDWLSLSRATLEKTALAVLARIADLCTANADAAGAMAAAERMFAIDRLDEEIHWRLLESCAAAGRRAEALRHYETIADALKRELGTTPGAKTRAIKQRLHQEMAPPLEQEARPEPRPIGSPPPIAVLPFTQIGNETVPSHLADGIMVDTICQLAGLRELQAISHGSTMAYRDPAMDLRQIGRELGVRYVVRGAMRRQGTNLRLSTELVDAGTNAVVWARSHDTSATLDFADQDRLVAQIVNTLAPRVQELELRRIRGQRPENLSVYEKVLLARAHLIQLEREAFATARTLLDEVVVEEPGYGEAFALLADWQSLSMNQGWTPYNEIGRLELDRLARTAMALDAQNVRALVLYAHRRALLHRDHALARSLFARALDIAPNAAHSWLWSSYTFAYDGDAAEAVKRVTRALDLSPRDQRAHDFYSAMCVALYAAGEYDAAASWGLRAMNEPGLFVATMRWTAASLAAVGRPSQAHEVARMALQVVPTQRAETAERNSPFTDPLMRARYSEHLLDAGFPP